MDPRYEKIFNIPSSDNPYYEHLYARGYLISDKPYVVKENWEQRSFGNGLYITYDGKNECAYVTLNDTWVLILGTVMDTLLKLRTPVHPQKSLFSMLGPGNF